MDPEAQTQALATPSPSTPPEAQAPLTLAPAPGASPSTIQTNPKILQSAMKTPVGRVEKLQKWGSESPRGSLRFLLPGSVVGVRGAEVGDEEVGDGRRGSFGESGCSDDDEEEASQRALLGTRRGIERRKRRGVGRRGRGSAGGGGMGERWWRDWRGTLALWVVLIVLGSAMTFVLVEDAGEEIPMPEAPGQGSSEGKRLFSLMSITGWGSKGKVGLVTSREPLEDLVEMAGWEVGGGGSLELELVLGLHKREVPDDAKWLYDAQDPSYDLVPDNATDKDKLIESRNGAVSSDVEICSEIGVGLMKRGGNAVDAVIGRSIPSPLFPQAFVGSLGASRVMAVFGECGLILVRNCCMCRHCQHVRVRNRRWRVRCGKAGKWREQNFQFQGDGS